MPCLSDGMDADRIPAADDKVRVVEPAAHAFGHPGPALERHHPLVFRVDIPVMLCLLFGEKLPQAKNPQKANPPGGSL